MLGDSGLSDNSQIYQAISEAMDQCPIPVFPMFSSVFSSTAIIDAFTSHGKVFFPDEVPLAQAVGRVAHWHKPEEAPSSLDGFDAWDGMLKIKDARGVLIQPVISGTEVILGASREGDSGYLIMFGLGGIYTEVLKDVQFSLAPLSFSESPRMIHGIRSYSILEGVRGHAGMDIDLLAENVQRLSLLVRDFPQIEEIDLNPIKGKDADLFVVDARIILKG